MRTMILEVQLDKKNIADDKSQGAWPQDELIVGKPPVVR
jgi:hypothetical protein